MSTEILPIQHDIDDDHHRFEIAAPHYELLEGRFASRFIENLFRIFLVLGHRSSQLQSFNKSTRSSDRTRYRSANSRKNQTNPIQEEPVKEIFFCRIFSYIPIFSRLN